MIAYRNDIDGLRAIAVASVVLYHIGLGCPGGFVGVDVFFVISGYLITSMILKDLRQGSFSLVNFWERRVRRIFPAWIAMVGITLLAGWFLLLPRDLARLGLSAIAQAFCVSNFYFWRTTNYFGGTNEQKPLLHTWSLGVEEQFYVIVPLLLMLAFSYQTLRRNTALLAMTITLSIASLALAMWGVYHQPFATFFLLPTRGWELSVGSLLAMLPAGMHPQTKVARELTGLLGLTGILLPIFAYSDKTPFPGMAALPPCLGAALFIWANMPAQISPTAAARLLSLKPIVFIGLISYSLYLWHWPILCLAAYWKTAVATPVFKAGLVAMSLVMACLSWRFIETPFRQKILAPKRKTLFAGMFAMSFVLSVTGLVFFAGNGLPNRMPLEVLRTIDAMDKNEIERKTYLSVAGNITELNTIENDGLPNIGDHSESAPLAFVLLGDSHAQCSVPIFDKVAGECGVKGTVITYQSTPPLVQWTHHLKDASQHPEEFVTAMIDYIRRNHIKNTFLLAYWSNYIRVGGCPDFDKSLELTISELENTGTHVWIILDFPDNDYDPVKSSVRNYLLPDIFAGAKPRTVEEHHERNLCLYSLATRNQDVDFLDPAPNLLDAATGTYSNKCDGIPIYFDHEHPTIQGEEIALEPLVRKSLGSIAASYQKN